ncbi:MAG: hypothetical protein RLZZ66_1087 [Pseudomonadota bacterium]|jgi:CRISPR-associated protein Cas1
MEQFTDSKAIFHSKRANIFYLEKCRVMVKAGRVVYIQQTEDVTQSFNIPIANTTVILLGSSTSITQSAVKMLASEGVLIGFSGSGGTPLLAAMEVEWFSAQNQYRPTEYLQSWMAFWFDEAKRLHIAKQLQQLRLTYMKQVWSKDKDFQREGFYLDDVLTEKAIKGFAEKMAQSQDVSKLLSLDTAFTKQLYNIASDSTKQLNFIRNEEKGDEVNVFLNQGEYLAYGLAATTLWVLGIPYGFALMHSNSRRGALVFDVADLIKDTLILPLAFICAKAKMNEQAFRQQCLELFTRHNALDFMFDAVKQMSFEGERL